ncbi:hypothetical protein ig2599ANME_0761 [groundwater metagenome]
MEWVEYDVKFKMEPEWMASSYMLPNSSGAYHIEKYYHHIFASDRELISLIEELGLGSGLEWLRGTTGYFSMAKYTQ